MLAITTIMGCMPKFWNQSSYWKLSSSRPRIPNGMIWNPLVQFLSAKMFKKFSSIHRSYGRKCRNAQSKAAKSVITQGKRARLAGLLLCAMQFHFKFEANFRNIFAHKNFTSGFQIIPFGILDLLDETFRMKLLPDCLVLTAYTP